MAPIIYKDKNYTIVYDQRGVTKRQISRILQLKGDIANVVYNDLDLSRFPDLTNDKVRAKLEAGESLTELIIDHIDLQKGGFINISALWKGQRKGPSPGLRKWLDQHGDESIIDLKLSKQPLSNYLTRFLDVISLGNFSKKLKDLGYKNAEHWGLNVVTNKGSYVIEKNAFVEARDMEKKANEQLVDIAANIPENLTIRNLINNAAKDDPTFWRYRARDKNCQKLVEDLLNKNNIEHNDEVAVQNAKDLVDSIGPAKPILNVVTDTAHVIDTVINGEGRRRIRAKHRANVTLAKK